MQNKRKENEKCKNHDQHQPPITRILNFVSSNTDTSEGSKNSTDLRTSMEEGEVKSEKKNK